MECVCVSGWVGAVGAGGWAELFFCLSAKRAFAVFHDLSACLIGGRPDSKINWPEWWWWIGSALTALCRKGSGGGEGVIFKKKKNFYLPFVSP